MGAVVRRQAVAISRGDGCCGLLEGCHSCGLVVLSGVTGGGPVCEGGTPIAVG